MPLRKRIARERIRTSDHPSSERISVVLPVLNEAGRIGRALDSLLQQPEEVNEILVVDGGSRDGTQQTVAAAAARDARVKLLDASPVHPSWTGKSWGLHFGVERADPACRWILCIDADARLSPKLARSLLAHAGQTQVTTFSVAARQQLSGAADALIHPAMLTTLVYRFGAPGRTTRNPRSVQANGQCFFTRRDILLATGALNAARRSLCEDITIARRMAERGEAVGFYETEEDLVTVDMYGSWRDTWDNWPRSLPMRDSYFDWRHGVRLVSALTLQALPLPLVIFAALFGAPVWLVAGAGLPAAIRIGILFGVARAYPRRPWTYWLSPLLDLPVAARILQCALKRRHTWRGRVYVRGRGGTFEPVREGD
jgi:dolichol-phosphate mannosyltransferase